VEGEIIKIQKKARSKHKGWSDSGDLTAANDLTLIT
jgi:hypothetical protein